MKLGVLVVDWICFVFGERGEFGGFVAGVVMVGRGGWMQRFIDGVLGVVKE